MSIWTITRLKVVGRMLSRENTILRPLIKEDLPYLNSWKNDEDVYKFLGGGFMPVSISIQEKWLDQLMDTTQSNKRFMICDSEKEPIGMAGLYNIHPIHRTCEIGLFIGNKYENNKGHGTNTAHLLEKFARDYLNIRKIRLLAVSENISAIKFWHKMNYLEIGKYKKERFIKGKYCDVTIMEKFIQTSEFL